MSMIFSNVGGDLKNYRLQVIDSWVDGESPELMDNPVDGDMISCRSLVDGVPTVTATKVYSDGEWVDAGGGGGGSVQYGEITVAVAADCPLATVTIPKVVDGKLTYVGVAKGNSDVASVPLLETEEGSGVFYASGAITNTFGTGGTSISVTSSGGQVTKLGTTPMVYYADSVDFGTMTPITDMVVTFAKA